MPDLEGLNPLLSSVSVPAVPTIEEHEAAYQYKPIVADEELRVLLLEPGMFGEPLVGRLLVRKIGDINESHRDVDWVPRGDGNEWDCVSYCWGPQKDYTYFSCDGHFLRITILVEEMLRHLREPFMPLYLWIDAICINRADNAEKGLQVRSMGRIYTIASSVIVWLGPAADQDRIDDLLPIFDDPDMERYVAAGVRTRPIASISFVFPSLDAFFSRGWFRRRWILQEVILSCALNIRCGRHEFTWRSLVHSARFRLDHEDNFLWTTGTQQAARKVTALDSQRIGTTFSQRHTHLSTNQSEWIYSRILLLVKNVHTAQCSDERDRLYSLYGMSPHSYEHCPINYEVHFSSSYADFAHAAIMAGCGHLILHDAISFGNLSQQDESWPSWVPSWNNINKMPRLAHCIRLTVKDQEKCLTKNSLARSNQWNYSDQFATNNIGNMRGLSLSGRVHPIGETQTSRGCSTAMQFFMDGLSRWPVAGPSHYSLSLASPVLAVAMYNAQFLCVKGEAEVQKFSTALLPSSQESTRQKVLLERQVDLIHRTVDIEMRKRLPNAIITADGFDSARLLQEANQLLEGQYAFRLDTSEGLIFGIAFARVEPGDLVFRRPTTSAPGYNVEPVCALVIRPYRSSSSTRQDLFRLVGVCVDSHALMHGSGPKYEERNIVLV